MDTLHSEASRRDLYRSLIGRFATGVTVVALLHEGKPRAITINSLTSVSLDPLIVLFCLRDRSSVLPLLPTGVRFSVNVLAGDQTHVCLQNAGKLPPAPDDRWPLQYGCPVVPDAAATFFCTVRSTTPCGDHHVIFANVDAMHAPERPRDALVFINGEFRSISLERTLARPEPVSA